MHARFNAMAKDKRNIVSLESFTKLRVREKENNG